MFVFEANDSDEQFRAKLGLLTSGDCEENLVVICVDLTMEKSLLLSNALAINTSVTTVCFAATESDDGAIVAMLHDTFRVNTTIKEIVFDRAHFSQLDNLTELLAVNSNLGNVAFCGYDRSHGQGDRDDNDRMEAFAAEMAQLFVNFFRAKKGNLKGFAMQSCGVSSAVCVSLMQSLESYPTLKYLVLSGNDTIEDEGAIAIATSLKTLKHLVQIDLCRCGIKEKGAVAFTECLKVNTSLQCMDLSGNEEMGDAGRAAFANAMSVNTFITQLIVSDHANIHQQKIDHCIRQNRYYKRYLERNREAVLPSSALPLIFDRVADRFPLLYLFVRDMTNVIAAENNGPPRLSPSQLE